MSASADLHVTLTGPWRTPQNEHESRSMAHWVRLSGEPAGRCTGCAFRTGTEANSSRMVLHLVEMCLLDEGNAFMCHHGLADDEPPTRVCAGFAALRERFAEAST